ncbi:MAG: hypothetical protein IJR97_02120 [Clostridia bacterium]|nr:hypothetical protein [Clostridia bacterium]
MRNKLLSVLLVLLLPCILLMALLNQPKIYQDSYYAELAPMTQRLKEAQGKRLVIIGGSNVAFGVDVPLLEQLLREKGFDYTVCPYGLYAAVGISAMLSLSEDMIREGDAVVLAFEPANDALSTYFGATAFLKCAEADPELILKLNGDQRSRVVGNLIPYLQEKESILRSGIAPKAEGVYAKDAFDSDCSMIYDRPGNQMALGYDTASPIDLDSVTAGPAFAELVDRWCLSAQKKGAAVYMSFSPMNFSAVSGDIAAWFGRINETFTCPIISDPTRYVLDSGWFYDSNFHLNSAGQTLRTCMLAEDLLAEWGCYEPLIYERPLMPDPVPVHTETNADSSADFLTEPLEDPALCRITGVTEAGLLKQTLIIPSSAGGRTVADIAQDALAGADLLEELHIPGTIGTLPDCFLSGCPHLKRLVLTHTSAPCGLKARSLEGAPEKMQILVPYSAYPWYRDGYGCEENPWQKYLGRIVSY